MSIDIDYMDTDSIVTNEMFSLTEATFKSSDTVIKTVEIFADIKAKNGLGASFTFSGKMNITEQPELPESDLELYNLLREDLNDFSDDDEKIFLKPFESEEVQQALVAFREGSESTELFNIFNEVAADFGDDNSMNLEHLEFTVIFAKKSDLATDFTYKFIAKERSAG